MSPRHILILRHGQTAMSAAGVYASRTDVPLSELGERTAAGWRESLSGIAGFHSPLVRASETASLAGVASEPLDDLREWDLGDLEGQASEDYREANPTWSLFRSGAPGGEEPRAIVERVDRVLAAVRDNSEEIVVLTGHGQLSKSMATRILELPLDAAIRFAWGPGRAALFSWRQSLGGYALTGWNRTPAPLDRLLEGNH